MQQYMWRGVSVIIITVVLVAFEYAYFHAMCDTVNSSESKQVLYLKDISSYGNFLRVLTMEWFLERKNKCRGVTEQKH